MTSHELARQLLALPDVPVIGRNVGQGSNEAGDEDLAAIEFLPTWPAPSGARIELIF
jgi:hypothetical protein